MRSEVRSLLLRAASNAGRLGHMRFRGRRDADPSPLGDVSALVTSHFVAIGEPEHRSQGSLRHTLNQLGGRPARILETGTAAWGSRSTILFSAYVEAFGGEVVTIDMRIEPGIAAFRSVPNSVRFIIGDSVNVLRRSSIQAFAASADLVYLDSWDVDATSPLPSATHGLSEFLAVATCLKKGALVLIDDTPLVQDEWGVETDAMKDFLSVWGVPVGKGSLVRKMLDGSPGFEVLMHDYQLLLRKT